jgi:hypothetical protein
MAKPYSDDLRERAVAAIESGHSREESCQRLRNCASVECRAHGSIHACAASRWGIRV